MKKSIYLLLIVMMFLIGCSHVETPFESESVGKINDTASTAAFPLSRYAISIDSPSGTYYTTDSNIVLRWNQLSPTGCPDFEKYRVYLNNSQIKTYSTIQTGTHVLGNQSIGSYSWRTRAEWSYIYSHEFANASFFVEIDKSVKGPNPVDSGSGATWYVDTLSGGSFSWQVFNSNGQQIYSTTNTSGMLLLSSWGTVPSGVYKIQCTVTCSGSNNVYSFYRFITVSN